MGKGGGTENIRFHLQYLLVPVKEKGGNRRRGDGKKNL